MHSLKRLGLGLGLIATTAVPAPQAVARAGQRAHAECDNTGCISEASNIQGVSGRRLRSRRRTPSACTFKVLAMPEGAPVYRSDGSVVEVDGTGRWYDKRCRVDVPQSDRGFGSTRGYGEFGRRAETSELVYLRRRAAAPAEVALEALDYLALPAPAIVTSPPPQFDSVVNLPVFLTIDAADWAPRSVTTHVPGVSVTVTAVPERVEWAMGTGDVVVCSGPGTPYDFTRGEGDQVADCTYRYRTTSSGQPNERFSVTATVVWRASWSVTGAPGGGDLGEVRRSSSTRLRVAQVQTVNVNG